ncbi:hypothetical protein GGF31_004965 [Allomyces arbusculus]|nr:hypothetical protein GGF31_004965 [Allomyces arbusculus]
MPNADLDSLYKLAPLADATDVDVMRFLDLMWVAFRDDPMWTALIPDDPALRHKANRFFLERIRFAGLVPHGHLVRERTTNRVVGHAAMIPPVAPGSPVAGTRPVSADFRAEMDAALGVTTAHRLEVMLGLFGETPDIVATARSDINDAVWTLQAVVIDPELQGRGIGAWAIRALLDQFPPVPVILYTQEDHNVGWYARKLGFELVDTREFCIDDDGDASAGSAKFTNWTMVFVPHKAKARLARSRPSRRPAQFAPCFLPNYCYKARKDVGHDPFF